MISDIKLLKLLHNNKTELNPKMMMSYMPLIYKLVFNQSSIRYTEKHIEDHVSDEYFEVLNYKNRISEQLVDTKKSLDEPDSKIITRKYYLNQSLKDISKNSGLKISTYA